jgi:arylsulfatase A-like enzyme
LVLRLFVALAPLLALAAPASRPPNIIFILADDLGYGDIGPFGQKLIRTPNLDRLAAQGMRLTQHYSGNNVCAPSRCVLMTGLHPGHAFIRDNREMKPEGQFPIPADTVTLPKLLRARGYVTGGFGKWGLGGPGTAGEPLRQGFDRWYGYNCQAVAHNFYPTHLWDDDRHIEIGNRAFSAHQKLPGGADRSDPSVYAGFSGTVYAPDLIAEQARAFVRANRDRPFFCYVPTTVPHLALQVPEDSLADYRGKFPEEPYDGSRGYLPHPTPRAAYAAMVTRMDRDIGRLLDLVRDLGLENDTIVVFSSDNGPLYDRLGGTDAEFFNSHGGLRGRKGSFYEGGFRVPTIVRWPGHIAAGSSNDRVTGFEDWVPTLLALIGAEVTTPRGLDGISFAPTLLGQHQPARPFLYRESPGYGGQQGLRVDNWKLVRRNLRPRPAKGEGAMVTELYDLSRDPAETANLAATRPEVLARLEGILREQHVPSRDFPLPALDR